MTKSEIFKKAHRMAKANVEVIGDYRVALSWSLKTIYNENEESKMTKATTKNFTGTKKQKEYAARLINSTIDYHNSWIEEYKKDFDRRVSQGRNPSESKLISNIQIEKDAIAKIEKLMDKKVKAKKVIDSVERVDHLSVDFKFAVNIEKLCA